MDIVGIIMAGVGAIQALLLLLFQPTEENMNETVQKDYEEFMKLRGKGSNTLRTKELIMYIADDGFNETVFKESRNWVYLSELKKLKESFVRFYFKRLDDITRNHQELDCVADTDNRIGEYIIQLMRLRKVIQPDVQVSINVHPRTSLKYLSIKAYWIDDSGKKVRKFTKSIGRAENYPGGIEDKQALEDGIKLIQPVLYENYKEIYKV